MKRSVLFILFTVSVINIFSLGLTEDEPADYQFALLIKKGDESWYRKIAEGFLAQCNELNAGAIILDNRMDPNVTLMNLDLAIDKKADGIAIIIPEQRMGPVIVNRAFESDTTIISIGHKLLDHQGRQLAPHLGVDDSSAGYEMGVWLAEYLSGLELSADPSGIVGIAGLTESDVLEYSVRVNECQRALFEWSPDLDEASYFQKECSGSDSVSGLLAMQELLNIHPEITNWVVFAATDESAIGALRALEQVGLGLHSVVCGIQAERAFSEFEKDDTALAAAVYFDPYEMGKKAAYSLYKKITAEMVIPAESALPFSIITAGNAAEAD